MTGFNVALRMRRDPLVAKLRQASRTSGIPPKIAVGDFTFFLSGRGVVIAFESLL
jgi:hypothetical protein